MEGELKFLTNYPSYADEMSVTNISIVVDSDIKKTHLSLAQENIGFKLRVCFRSSKS